MQPLHSLSYQMELLQEIVDVGLLLWNNGLAISSEMPLHSTLITSRAPLPMTFTPIIATTIPVAKLPSIPHARWLLCGTLLLAI